MSEMYVVRTYFRENGELVYLDEGPWDHYLAELVLADIGIDASIPRGMDRVVVERAIIVPAAEADL